MTDTLRDALRAGETLSRAIDEWIVTEVCRRHGINEQAFRAAYAECVKRGVKPDQPQEKTS